MTVECPKCQTKNTDTQKFCGECGTDLNPSIHGHQVTKTIETPYPQFAPETILADRYEIIRELGRGGMGVVYKAEDTKLKRNVALKFLPQELTHISDIKERFIREAQSAAALDHPNICTIYEFDEAEEKSFISMAYIEGQSLRKKIESGPLELEEALHIAVQVSKGLQEAHKKGIVHRDIKSANIMVTEDNQVKIMDFGLARKTGGTLITKNGMTMGTIAYMSPEQARGEAVDQRTDIWSFGVMLYEMVTGEHPFKGENDQAVLYNIINEEPESITSLRKSLPLDLERIVNKAIFKKSDKRYQTIKELLTDLKDLQKVMETRASKTQAESKEIKPSIAVLPFVNMSADPEQGYFCDGMAEEIINALTHVEGLHVVARTSAFSFKGKEIDIREIGKILTVDHVLEGSVRKASNRLRITAQLINVVDGYHLWSERYDRKMEDVFDIQDELSLSIVESLKVKLMGHEKAVILTRHTENQDAYTSYLQGKQFRQRKDLVSFKQALEYLEKAITLDPNFALAYAEIALTYVLMGWFGFVVADEKLREKIVYHADKALKLDKRISDAYLALALTWELIDHDQVKAEEFAHKAVSLNPGNSEAIQEHGFILGRMGKFEEAIKKMETTIALDPLSSNANNGLGFVLFYKGDFEAAIKQMQNILALDPDFFPPRYCLSLSLTELKDYSHALKELKKCPQSNPVVIAHRGYIYAKMGKIKEACNTIDEIKEDFKENPLTEFLIALIYAGMDDKDNAFNWLRMSENKHGFVYRDFTVGPDFRIDNLRKDPRFSKFSFF